MSETTIAMRCDVCSCPVTVPDQVDVDEVRFRCANCRNEWAVPIPAEVAPRMRQLGAELVGHIRLLNGLVEDRESYSAHNFVMARHAARGLIRSTRRDIMSLLTA